MSDGQRYTKAVNLQGFRVPVMSGTWKSGATFMALSDRSLSLKTIIQRGGKWRNGAIGHPEQWVVPQKTFLMSMQISTFSVWLQCPSRPTVCFRILFWHHMHFLKCYILLYIYIYLINHLVDLEQKQYSQLRAVFKVYSKPCFPSLSVDLSQKRLRGTGPMALIKAETLQLFGECMRGENAWKWKRGMYVCVNLASTSRMQSLDKVAYIIHTH